MPASHHWLDVVGMGCLASHMMTPSGWSWRFLPTPAESTTTSTPTSRRCAAGPMPDSISSLGVSMDPQDTITSRRARTVRVWIRSGSRYSAPTQRRPSSTSFLARTPVRTSRFGRLPMTGCRYATDEDCRTLFSSELIWNQLAPRTTVLPVLNAVVAMPACAHASSRAKPQGSAPFSVRSFTGPVRPWWSPGASFDSNRW